MDRVLDYPFQDRADTATTRRIILEELHRARELVLTHVRPGAANTFEWLGTTMWLDQRRWIACAPHVASRFPTLTTLPDTEQDLLDVYGGDSRQLFAEDVLAVFARRVAGAPRQTSVDVTYLCNTAVIQPMVNPGFGPLFWVGLSLAFDSRDTDDVMAILRPMALDMTRYPARSEVRAAQATLFERFSPELLPPDWERLDDRAWVDACKQLLASFQYAIEWNVFEMVTQRARLI